MKKVLLYSGGMDSWLAYKLWKPDVLLMVNLGTEGNAQEIKRALADPEMAQIVKIANLDLGQFERKDQNYYLPLRNLHLATLAAHYGNVICFGAVGSDVHYDEKEEFCQRTQDAINYLLSEKGEEPVQIVMPFRNVSKTALLAQYVREGGQLETAYRSTFSCYSPVNGKECLACSSCAAKFAAFYNNGYQFSAKEKEAFADYVSKHREGQSLEVLKAFYKVQRERSV